MSAASGGCPFCSLKGLKRQQPLNRPARTGLGLSLGNKGCSDGTRCTQLLRLLTLSHLAVQPCPPAQPSSGAGVPAAFAQASAMGCTLGTGLSTACAGIRWAGERRGAVCVGSRSFESRLSVGAGYRTRRVRALLRIHTDQPGCLPQPHQQTVSKSCPFCCGSNPQAPEMVRVPLEELVLQIHLLRLGRAGAFLARVLQVRPGGAWGCMGSRRRGSRAACLATGSPEHAISPQAHSHHAWFCPSFSLFITPPAASPREVGGGRNPHAAGGGRADTRRGADAAG